MLRSQPGSVLGSALIRRGVLRPYGLWTLVRPLGWRISCCACVHDRDDTSHETNDLMIEAPNEDLATENGREALHCERVRARRTLEKVNPVTSERWFEDDPQ
jgi:hypothetical protein